MHNKKKPYVYACPRSVNPPGIEVGDLCILIEELCKDFTERTKIELLAAGYFVWKGLSKVTFLIKERHLFSKK